MNPSEMTDEELQKVIETGVEPEVQTTEVENEESKEEVEEPVEETQKETETEPEEKVEEKVEEKSEEEAPTEKPISRRESLRVQQLLQKYGQPQERPKAPSQVSPNALDYGTALDADPEIVKQLETDRQTVSDAAYLEGLRQSEVKEWKRDLKFEAPVVEEKFPFLNPRDTANFKPAAADAMNQKYLRFIGYNPGDPQKGVPETIQYPDLSYREFVESEMEFVEELATQKVADTTKNIAKQAATTGLRPDGSSAKRLNLNQSEKDMSLEELYAAIGQTPPK
jgi:hypothetical protein